MESKIKTFEDACAALGIDSEKVLPDFSGYPENHRAGMLAHAKLVLIVEALNDGWKPDWGDSSQWKYEPWFHMGGSSGSGFAYCDDVHWSPGSCCGSRLCFRTREMAEYAGGQFKDLYKEYYLLNS